MSLLTRIVRYLMVGLIVILPIQQFWIRPLEIGGVSESVISTLNYWAAPVIIGLALAAFIRVRPLRFLDKALLVFIVLALIPLLWHFSNETDLLVGYRYTLFAMLGYWTGRGQYLPEAKTDRLVRFALRVVMILSVFQLALWLLNATSLWQTLGLEPAFTAGNWWRLYGPMSGPNQLGTFLTISGLWLYWRRQIGLAELLAVAAVVFLTISRSALLGLGAGLFITPIIFEANNRRRLMLVSLVAVLVVVAGLMITFYEPLNRNLVDARRPDLRISILQDTAARFRSSSLGERAIGHGAGTAGPAATKLDNGGFIPENWFLQVTYEFGLFGLLAILTFLVGLIILAKKSNQPALAAIVLAIGVNSMFLHPLSDNFATAFLFYLLSGSSLPGSQTKQNKIY